MERLGRRAPTPTPSGSGASTSTPRSRSRSKFGRRGDGTAPERQRARSGDAVAEDAPECLAPGRGRRARRSVETRAVERQRRIRSRGHVLPSDRQPRRAPASSSTRAKSTTTRWKARCAARAPTKKPASNSRLGQRGTFPCMTSHIKPRNPSTPNTAFIAHPFSLPPAKQQRIPCQRGGCVENSGARNANIFHSGGGLPSRVARSTHEERAESSRR
jgi:hypothetical protein